MARLLTIPDAGIGSPWASIPDHLQGMLLAIGRPLLFLTACYLAVVAVLNYGITAAMIGPMPVHHGMLALALVGSLAHLRGMPAPLLLPPLLLCITGLRLLGGDGGFWALRDASQVVDMQWVLVGWGLVASGTCARLRRWVLPLVAVATGYWLLYPLNDLMIEVGPRVGLHGSGLLGHYSNLFLAGFCFLMLLLWSDRIRPAVLLTLCTCLGLGILMSMSRLTMGSVVVCALYLVVIRRMATWIPVAAVGLSVGAVLIIGVSGIEIETRYGQFDSKLLWDAALSVVGAGDNTAAANGIYQRIDWWWSGIMGTLSQPWGWLWGQGYGVILTDHGTVGDIATRELHNSWISAFCRLGLIGITGLVTLFSYLIWQLLRQRDVWRHVGVIATVFILAVTMVEPGFENPYTSALIWSALGGACAYLRARAGHSATPEVELVDEEPMPEWMRDELPLVVVGEYGDAIDLDAIANEFEEQPPVVIADDADDPPHG